MVCHIRYHNRLQNMIENSTAVLLHSLLNVIYHIALNYNIYYSLLFCYWSFTYTDLFSFSFFLFNALALTLCRCCCIDWAKIYNREPPSKQKQINAKVLLANC